MIYLAPEPVSARPFRLPVLASVGRGPDRMKLGGGFVLISKGDGLLHHDTTDLFGCNTAKYCLRPSTRCNENRHLHVHANRKPVQEPCPDPGRVLRADGRIRDRPWRSGFRSCSSHISRRELAMWALTQAP